VEERLVNTALKRPNWFWGPLSLLFIGYGGFFLRWYSGSAWSWPRTSI